MNNVQSHVSQMCGLDDKHVCTNLATRPTFLVDLREPEITSLFKGELLAVDFPARQHTSVFASQGNLANFIWAKSGISLII